MSRTKIGGLTFLSISVILCSGCAKLNLLGHGSSAASTKDLLVVTAPQTPFYRYGPQQTAGPDRQLPHGKPREVVLTLQDYFTRKFSDPDAGKVRLSRRTIPQSLRKLGSISRNRAYPTPSC